VTASLSEKADGNIAVDFKSFLMRKIYSIGDLLNKIGQLRTKNRDLLSVEDMEVLGECEEALKELLCIRQAESASAIWEKATRVVVLLLKFFSETDLF
jgi:hypothetical protein